MTSYKTLLDPGVYLGAHDLKGMDVKLTIARIAREELPSRKKQDGTQEPKESAPMIYFSHKGVERDKRWKVPKSCMYALNLLFGSDYEAWIGKEITLFPVKCMAFGEIEDAIRIRLSADQEAAIYKWLKKRKANRNAYIMQGAP